jgi:hypothetical protein
MPAHAAEVSLKLDDNSQQAPRNSSADAIHPSPKTDC